MIAFWQYINLQLGGNDLSSLADLKRVVDVSSINGSAGGTDYNMFYPVTWLVRVFPPLSIRTATSQVLTGSANLVSHVVQQSKVLAVLHATATSNDAGSAVELGAVRLLHVLTDKLASGASSGGGGILRGSSSISMARGREGSAADSDDLDAVVGLDGSNRTLMDGGRSYLSAQFGIAHAPQLTGYTL
jgi:hypothetical protein